MRNKEMAKIFQDMANFLESEGVAFKPYAYEKAAISLSALKEDVGDIYIKGGTKTLQEIPGVGKDVLYAMLVTALYNAGMDIVIAKSMEDRFLGNVQRQEDLIREGFIDPVAAPRMGHLRPVTHTFSATVTLYEASENDPQFGPITFEIQGVRMRHASIRIDFALEEIYSGDVEKAFYVEAAVQERTGPVLGDASYDIRSIWMIAFDDALSQMVEYLSTASVPARE